MNKKSIFKILAVLAFSITLYGCGEDDEAKKLGFSSVTEMNSVHALGWHTKIQYDSDQPRIKKEEEERIAAEEAKRMAEEERKRIAKENEPKSLNVKNLKVNMIYEWSQSVKANEGNSIYVTLDDYKKLCESAEGLTKKAVSYLSMFDSHGASAYLIENGNIDNIEIEWKPSTQGNFYLACSIAVSVSGIYKGSSSRGIIDSWAKTFIVNDKGEVLIHTTNAHRM